MFHHHLRKSVCFLSSAALVGACAQQRSDSGARTKDAEVNFGLPDENVLSYDSVEIYGIKGTGKFVQDYEKFPSSGYKTKFTKAQLQQGFVPAQFNLGEDWIFAMRIFQKGLVVAETGLGADETECPPTNTSFAENGGGEFAVNIRVCRGEGSSKSVVPVNPGAATTTTTTSTQPAAPGTVLSPATSISSNSSAAFVPNNAFVLQGNGKAFQVVTTGANMPRVDAQGNLHFAFRVTSQKNIPQQCQFAFALALKASVATATNRSQAYTFTSNVTGPLVQEIPVIVLRTDLGADAERYQFTTGVSENATVPLCR